MNHPDIQSLETCIAETRQQIAQIDKEIALLRAQLGADSSRSALAVRPRTTLARRR